MFIFKHIPYCHHILKHWFLATTNTCFVFTVKFPVYMCVQTHKQFVWVLLTFSAHLLRETNLCIITVLPLNIPTHSNTHTLSPSAYIYTRSHIFNASTYTHSHLCCNSMNNHHLNGTYLSLHLIKFRWHIIFHVMQPLLLKPTSGHIVKYNSIFILLWTGSLRSGNAIQMNAIQITLSVTIKP